MSQNQWSLEKIKQYKEDTGQALLSDEQSLVLFGQDFGKLIQSQPVAVSAPQSTESLQSLILFANQYHLPVTIRGNGLSQGGQSLPVPGGLTISMQSFNKPLDLSEDLIWVEANTSWKNLLEKSLLKNKAPYVLPYNCNLSVGGVLSAGGIGASSFKYGVINAYVSALEVVDGLGESKSLKKTHLYFKPVFQGKVDLVSLPRHVFSYDQFSHASKLSFWFMLIRINGLKIFIKYRVKSIIWRYFVLLQFRELD